MKNKLNIRHYLLLSSMLFGMFFGAGNLIFPVYLGQLSGSHLWLACLGFCVTGVTLPLLGIISIGITHSEGLLALSSKINKFFAYIFTCILYLTIGPLFAIPRTATVSFTIGVAPYVAEKHMTTALLIFSLFFFAFALWFSLKSSKILHLIGKAMNPIFLILLFILVLMVICQPLQHVSDIPPLPNYERAPFFAGLINGYNTMDALASLAFGIILIDAIKSLGVKNSKEIAAATVKSGILSVLLMAVIYFSLSYVGTQAHFMIGDSGNGGLALYQISHYYFGEIGSYFLAALMIFACLKTSIGLVSSCSSTFVELFPTFGNYKIWAVIFTLFSFVISNFGLNKILAYSVPVLLFLYPLTIVLIFLAIGGYFLRYSKLVYNATMFTTVAISLLGILKIIPLISTSRVLVFLLNLEKGFPLYDIGLSWLFPSLLAFFLSLWLDKTKVFPVSKKTV